MRTNSSEWRRGLFDLLTFNSTSTCGWQSWNAFSCQNSANNHSHCAEKSPKFAANCATFQRQCDNFSEANCLSHFGSQTNTAISLFCTCTVKHPFNWEQKLCFQLASSIRSPDCEWPMMFHCLFTKSATFPSSPGLHECENWHWQSRNVVVHSTRLFKSGKVTKNATSWVQQKLNQMHNKHIFLGASLAGDGRVPLRHFPACPGTIPFPEWIAFEGGSSGILCSD